MKCFWCGREVPGIGKDVKAVLCSDDVAKLAAPPDIKAPIQRLSYEERKANKEAKVAKKKEKLEKLKTVTRGKGKGWHLKKLFHYEGSYFSFGKEITAAEAGKLMKQLQREEPKLEATKKGTTAGALKRGRKIKRKV